MADSHGRRSQHRYSGQFESPQNAENFCVSHESPLVPETLIDFVIGLGEYRPQRGAHISQLDPFWDCMRPIAYGAAGNYVIPRAIEAVHPAADLQGVFSHRKIVVRSAIGQPAARFPSFREVSLEAARKLKVEDVRPFEGNEFLLGRSLTLPQRVLRQYAEKHHVIDLIDYLSIAAKMGVLTPDEAREFSLSDTLIPGGCELGIYPTGWLCETLRKLELVGREYLVQHASRVKAYDAYQVRAVGFLAERLGSYFVLKELRRRYAQQLPRSLFGHICVIVPSGGAYQRATADGQKI